MDDELNLEQHPDTTPEIEPVSDDELRALSHRLMVEHALAYEVLAQ